MQDVEIWVIAGVMVIFAACVLGAVLWALGASLVNSEGQTNPSSFWLLVIVLTIAILAVILGDQVGDQEDFWDALMRAKVGVVVEAFGAALMAVLVLTGLIRFMSNAGPRKRRNERH